MPSRLRSVWHQDGGLALITVLMAITMISAVVTLLLTQSIRQLEQAEFLEREDIVLAGTEAMLERYASKMTLDPLYYLHTVDESERARQCDTAGLPTSGSTIQPGNPWDSKCVDWTYVDPADNDGDGSPDWYVHPLLQGQTTNGDVATLLEVTPPLGSEPLRISVVGRRGQQINRRMITASIDATSLSEFFRALEGNLNYGSGAEIFGKIYTGGNVGFSTSSIVHDNVFAEGEILTDPTKANSLVGFYDGNGVTPSGHNDSHLPIRSEIETPLVFSDFWDDLSLLTTVACDGGDLCLDDAGTAAWMVHPYISGSTAMVQIWRTTSTPSQSGLNVEQFLWLKPEDPSITWVDWGAYPIPDNGALWANAHVVVGSRNWAGGVDYNGVGGNDSVLGKSLTIYAGSAADRQNVIVNADLLYEDPDGNVTFGLIGSDEIILNPQATGSDGEFLISASLLAQNNTWRVPTNAGLGPPSGNNWELTIDGSIATVGGGTAGGFSVRNYLFDNRLEFLRPPFYPLLGNDWSYEDWREVPLPDWAQN